MIVVNTDYIPGKEFELIGLVTGSCIMCKNIGKDIGASFRNIAGGEMRAYTELMVESKDKAVNYMVGQAQGYGADAIINVRFSSTSIVQGGAEILVAGTAVKFKN